MKVPLFVPWITNDDRKKINSALEKSQLTDGPLLRKLEKQISHLVGSNFAVGVSNGTAALHLSLVNIRIGEGDEVIVPDFTFIATVNAILLCKAMPIFADIDSTLNISVNSLKSKISKKTKAIIPVHFAGYPCNIKEISKIAKKNNLYVIEDCAHALGAYVGKKHVGTFGNSGCFSFYPTKNITTIEGGMVVTNSKKIAETIRKQRNHGLSKTLLQRDMSSKPWIYDVSEPGYNYRLDEVRAALGLSQLARINEITKKRVLAAKYYNKKLKNVKGIEIVNYDGKNNHVYHLYIIRIKNAFGLTRNEVHEKLIKKSIRTTVHYKPIHLFSYFKKFKLKNSEFPETMKAYQECLTIPLFPTITREQQDYVIENILKLKK